MCHLWLLKRATTQHVVFLVWIHGEVVERANRAQVLGRTELGVLRRVEVLPRNADIVVPGIATDVNRAPMKFSP